MYDVTLRHGLPIQIMIPRKLDIERSRQGAIHLRRGDVLQITDDEASYIRKQMDDPKSGLAGFSIVLTPVEQPKAAAEPAKAAPPPPPPEPVAEAEPEPEAAVAEPAESEPPKGKPKGGRRRKS